jgi:hypothetical protein
VKIGRAVQNLHTGRKISARGAGTIARPWHTRTFAHRARRSRTRSVTDTSTSTFIFLELPLGGSCCGGLGSEPRPALAHPTALGCPFHAQLIIQSGGASRVFFGLCRRSMGR